MSEKKNYYIVEYKNNRINLNLSDKVYIKIATLTDLYFKYTRFISDIHDNDNWSISYIEFIHKDSEYEKVIIESDVEDDIVYYFSKRKKEILIYSHNLSDRWIAQCILRLIRNIFKLLELEKRELFAHGGLISLSGKGIAIVGGKKCGKTTTILSCIKAGADFITNDDVSFNIENNRLMAYGWPRGVAVRGDSLKMILQKDDISNYYAELNHPGNEIILNSTFNGREPNGLIFFQPQELVTLFKCNQLVKSDLHVIIFTEFFKDKDEETQLYTIDFEEGIGILGENLMSNPGKYNEFLLDAFVFKEPNELLNDYKDLFKFVSFYRLKIGFNNVSRIPDLIKSKVDLKL